MIVILSGKQTLFAERKKRSEKQRQFEFSKKRYMRFELLSERVSTVASEPFLNHKTIMNEPNNMLVLTASPTIISITTIPKL
ncbi:hypothetical protein C5167_000956 [Papaver somniferum]|uniref:Uncharacterized protein n=1 Tax=Papaver somniferum TaxID=3469 RepID=A0A4Y7KU30_PAPSO|nr:hypothetical protein C5167_000956 [Papaver somniferum]